MKRFLAIIAALCLVAALFAGCQTTETPAEPTAQPTEAPQATEVPDDTPDVTEAAATNTPEVTKAPDPTPVPVKDPYEYEILDWMDAYGYASSFDSIFINSKQYDGTECQAWKAENDDTVDGTDGKVKTIAMRGWAGFTDNKIKAFGYQVDNNPVIYVARATESTEQGVKDSGGEYAQRFKVTIPVSGLCGEGHEIKLVARIDDEDNSVVYLNNDLGPFILYYNGPEAPQPAIDGSIEANEYIAQYSLKRSTTKTWTEGSAMGSTVIDYYVCLREDGLYVGIDAKTVAAGDVFQLYFNPAALLDDAQALIVSFVTGEELKVLQSNHATALCGEADANGIDITSLVEAKMTAKEGGYVIEAKLPVDLFKVTDVEKADTFNYGRDNLYFGMFVLLGNVNGFTNQSAAPGEDWTCKGLALHEYIAY